MTFPRLLPAAALAIVGVAALTGCVQRTINITSEPPGALVWLNDREVGRTPLDVEFLYYGTYDVRLVKEGYEPLLTKGEANAPLWDLPGLDLAAEVAPVRLHSNIEWHYELLPVENDPDALIERAQQMRARSAEAETADEPG
ncbi:MAG: PEGA domain-containing protein [Phycisphaerales bacterium]|nr:MAG: PEGA domain-containing protein [Phycisphaerales bacterium]